MFASRDVLFVHFTLVTKSYVALSSSFIANSTA